MKIFLLKRIILFLLMLAVIIFAYRAVMQDVHKLSEEDIFICVDTVRECKVYVTPDTLQVTGDKAFDVNVKKFFYNKLVVTEEKFFFWEEGGVILYRVDDSDKNFKISEDKIATEIFNYGIKFLNMDYEICYQ